MSNTLPSLTKKQQAANRARARRMARSLRAYARLAFFSKGTITQKRMDLEGETIPIDMLADLMHFCDVKQWDFEDMLRLARGHYDAESMGVE